MRQVTARNLTHRGADQPVGEVVSVDRDERAEQPIAEALWARCDAIRRVRGIREHISAA